MRGDITREARLRTAAEFKLEEACSQREEVGSLRATECVGETSADLNGRSGMFVVVERNGWTRSITEPIYFLSGCIHSKPGQTIVYIV